MNRGVNGIIRFVNEVTICMVSAMASAAGTTIWNSVLKPKVLNAIDAKKKVHKNPIGFRVD